MAWLSISLELDPAPAEALSEALIEAGVDSVALEPLDPAGARVRLSALAGAEYRPGGDLTHGTVGLGAIWV